uniref:Nuclear pore protein n=1 Tax=Tetradesmus obliquus TaxID=3088 RepID=A0A383W7X6_TETOB|eukprot:jgi/Sobl393_1/15684/SZX73094.1
MTPEQTDWLSLVHQTNDLVAQDRHGYPKVQRDLTGLLLSSQSARARTSRVRSQDEQAAATRLLAMQGFDAGRLNQDVAMLELQPTLEDVFHADTTSVEDYLQQIQDMTILTAIQEAQQDTIMSFERYMSDCMNRDWANDKAGLFSSVAPFTGLSAGGSALGGLSFGSVARGDTGAYAGGAKLGPQEQAYMAVVKQLTAAAAAAAAGGGAAQPDPITAFGAACEQYEDKSPDTLMSNCWKLLGDILSIAQGKGATPAQGTGYVEMLLQGGRNHLQSGFAAHMRSVVSRHRSTAQRGADPDPLRDVQAYLAVKFRDKGLLDITAPGGVDTTWAQVYYGLRSGMHDVALRAAERALDFSQRGAAGGGSVKQLLQAWLGNAAGFRSSHGARMVQECERLLQSYNQKQGQLKQDYQLLVYALMAGDSRSVDTLFKLSPGLFPTMEDYIWVKLSLVNTAPAAAGAGSSLGGGSSSWGGSMSPSSGGGLGQGAPAYTLAALQAELNRWGPKYYSKDGAEPLLFLTVLLLSLQFKRGLAFLLKSDMAKAYRLDGIHLALALHFTGVLACNTDDPAAGAPLDLSLPDAVASFGRRYVASDSSTALQYYMLAAELAGGGVKEQGKLFRELLVQSKDYGTLLGGGGALGSGGAIQQFVPNPKQRANLFESVAYDCQINQQPDEARELFMAAQKPRAALRIINQQLSAAIHASKGAVTESVAVLLSRGQAAVEAIAAAPDPTSRRDAEAFQQLQLIRQMVELAGQGQWDKVLQASSQLSFIPTEKARIEVCKLEVRQLDDSVRERMSDVLQILAAAISQAKSSPDSHMLSMLRERVACLKVFVLDLDPSITPQVYERINACVREFS